MNKILILLIFNLTILNMMSAQDYKDCGDAIILCGESPFRIEPTDGIGLTDPAINNSCVITEFNSFWIELHISSPGDLIFDIIPDEFVDVDFVLFEWVNQDCNSLEMVRCMATGASTGGPTNQDQCMGSTGLLYGEIDTVETAGCSEGDNNYVAPVDVEEGEIYLLMINNFTNSTGYDLLFGGTSKIECITTNTSETEINDAPFTLKSSNPTSNELAVQINQNIKSGELCLYNMNGSLVYNQWVRTGELVTISDLNVSGAHIIVLKTKHQVSSKKVLLFN